MNILLFVSSLLIILSLLTYVRIENYRSFLGMEAHIERFMTQSERSYTSAVATKWYDTTLAPNPKERANDGNDKQQRDGKSAPRLSFRIFIDERMQEENPGLQAQTAQTAKKLMTHLYSKQQFFQKAELQNPSFLDRILEGISNAASQLPKEQKPKHATDLSNLELEADIQEIFYHMLKGCQNLIKAAKKPIETTSPSSTLSSGNEGSDADSEETEEEGEEYVKEGYDSLLNYITLRNTTKIRVYLAARPLLEAIFGQSSVADQIISARQNLYQSVKNKSLTAKDATQQFKDMFQGYAEDPAMLDFQVSLTNPARY